jgi:hypothetical protein
MSDEKTVSLSGSPIYNHTERKRPFEVATGSEDAEKLDLHIEQYVGEIDMVYHEIISDLVHIDVHHIKPTSARNVHTLVTTGMSDRPMLPPEQMADCKYAELLITLPPDWLISSDAFQDEANYWPVRLLKWLARFPHEYETWLWYGHTIPNGNPPEPFHHSTKLDCAMLAPPLSLSEEFHSFQCNEEKEVHFFSVIPLYPEEVTLKLRNGSNALFDLFDKYKIDEVVDLNRRNVAKKWWKPF